MRTISPSVGAKTGLTASFEDLLALVDRLCEGGTSVLALLAAYDSGVRADGTGPYPQDNLYNGLAIGNLTGVNQLIGTWDNWDRLVQKVRDCGMRLFTWLNPSYVWAGSDLYADPANVGFFRWCGNDAGVCPSVCSETAAEEAEEPYPPAFGVKLSAEAGCEWVHDSRRTFPDSYYSVWSGQPSGDFAQEDWRGLISDALAFWIERGVDGFVLDDPTRYVGVGSDVDDPSARERMAQAITEPVRTYASKEGLVPLLGETYADAEFVAGFGLDGGMGDEAMQEPIYDAIGAATPADRPGLAEPAFRYLDAAHAQCNFREDGWCAIAWQRMVPRLDPSWQRGNVLAHALSAAAGYFTAVESFSDGPWWEGEEYPGEGDPDLKEFFLAIRHLDSFGHRSLRAPALGNLGGGDVYGVVRYDAFCSGKVGLFAVNLGPVDGALIEDWTSAPLDSAVWRLPPHGFRHAELHRALPTWRREGGHLNCFDGSTHQLDHGSVSEMTLGACLLRCAGDDGRCKQVTVEWLGGDQAGKVRCWGHEAISGDSCREECGDACYSTFTLQDGPGPQC